uniref:SET domain-containing protein n=1 Tax=Globodera rostochiensis TaxID=31243 RepID=A0A914HL84_GLORO
MLKKLLQNLWNLHIHKSVRFLLRKKLLAKMQLIQTKMDDANGGLVTEDLSNGAELNKLRVINQYNEEVTEQFEYIVGTEKASNLDCLCKTSGCVEKCHCDQDCSNLHPVACFQVFYANPEKKWALQTLDDIEDGTPLFEYTGVLSKVGKDSADIKQDDYIIGFTHLGENYLLDAYRKGNLARFVNHSCQPNCRALLATIENDDQRVPRVVIYAIRTIYAGEELVMDYGQQWWFAKADTVDCQCMSDFCKYGGEWRSKISECAKNLQECSIATKAVDAKYIAAKSVDGQVIAAKLVDGREIAIKSVEGRAIAGKLADGRAVATKSVGGGVDAAKFVRRVIVVKLADGRAVATKSVIAAKSVDGRVNVATKSVDGQVIAAKSVAIKSVGGQVIAAKSVDGQVIAAKSVDGRVNVATKSVDGRVNVATKLVDGQVIAAKSVDGQVIAAKSVDGRVNVATKSVDGQVIAAKSVATKSVDGQVIAAKSIAIKSVIAEKSLDGRVIATKSVGGRVNVATKSVDGQVIAAKSVAIKSVIAEKSLDGRVIAPKSVGGRVNVATKSVDGHVIAAKSIAIKSVGGRVICN